MSRPRRVDQVIPSLASRDAIGNHTLQVRALLRDLGLESDIYYGNATADVAGEGRPLDALGPVHPERWLLYQMSIGSPAGEVVAGRDDPLLVNYHNITPAELLARFEPAIAEEARWGRAQLGALAGRTRLAVCDSAYNAGELERAGYRSTAVVPLLVDFAGFGGAADPECLARLEARRAAGGADWLFVGKVAPHKAEHDLVKALAVYRRIYDPRARLTVVGGAISEAYRRLVEELAAGLGLAEAVTLVGSVSHGELVAHYQAADVFTCASDHEGFCVPLVEAMYHRLPVVAHGVAAVPETVGGAGVLVADKDPLRFAATVHRVLADAALRRRLADAAGRRVADLALERNRDRLGRAVEAAVASA